MFYFNSNNLKFLAYADGFLKFPLNKLSFYLVDPHRIMYIFDQLTIDPRTI